MRTLVAIAATAVFLAAPGALAAPPGAPVNDDYLSSLSLNQPGSKLERTDTLRDGPRNNAAASVQTDVFAPPRSGGPPEPTSCRGAAYGKTVWYDFYPDVPGVVRLRANGFDSVINVVPFNVSTAVPNFAAGQCVNESSSTTEEFLVKVAKGQAYTVQIGAVGLGGPLEFLFDFLADVDGDGVLDDVDKCPRLKGTAGEAGCPVRLSTSVTLRAVPTSSGIRIASLRVKAPKGARVSVRCTGCPPQAKKAKTVRFGRLSGRAIRAGGSVVIRVTKKNAIGSYTKYKVSRGNFNKIERCLNPGSTKPRKKCG